MKRLNIVEFGKEACFASANELGNSRDKNRMRAVRGQIGALDDPFGIPNLHSKSRCKHLVCCGGTTGSRRLSRFDVLADIQSHFRSAPIFCAQSVSSARKGVRACTKYKWGKDIKKLLVTFPVG